MHDVPNSLRTLLTDLIDYAGLFPPAALDMKTAVANYARYRTGEYAWMLGRFVLPAARLTEFEKELPLSDSAPWRLSVLCGPKLDQDMAALEAFAPQCNKRAAIDCVETKVGSADEVARAHQRIGTATLTYYEVPLEPEVPKILNAIKSVGGRAKIRTGGLSAEAFPPAEVIAKFLVECAHRDLAFKATAGLHHPVRCVKPFTYEKDSPSGVMHGFLNVAIAAAATWASGRAFDCDERSLLRNSAPEGPKPFRLYGDDHSIQKLLTMALSTFDFRDDGVHAPWQFPIDVIAKTRRDFFISFGSCSFEEPIADLRALNLL